MPGLFDNYNRKQAREEVRFFCERISVLGQECGMVTIRGLQLLLKRCDRFSSSSGCWQYVPPERNRKGEGFGEWLFDYCESTRRCHLFFDLSVNAFCSHHLYYSIYACDRPYLEQFICACCIFKCFDLPQNVMTGPLRELLSGDICRTLQSVIYIYSFSRCFYSKQLTIEEYKWFIIKRQIDSKCL